MYTEVIQTQVTQTQVMQTQVHRHPDAGMHDQGMPGAAAGADGPVAGPGPEPGFGAGPGPGLAISAATGGAAGQVAGPGPRPGVGMPVVTAATGVGPRMLMGQIYDAIQNEYTPVVAPEMTAPPQPIAMEMHSVVNGVLYRHQGYTVDARSCCTFMVSVLPYCVLPVSKSGPVRNVEVKSKPQLSRSQKRKPRVKSEDPGHPSKPKQGEKR
jgi:hypothetical protein